MSESKYVYTVNCTVPSNRNHHCMFNVYNNIPHPTHFAPQKINCCLLFQPENMQQHTDIYVKNMYHAVRQIWLFTDENVTSSVHLPPSTRDQNYNDLSVIVSTNATLTTWQSQIAANLIFIFPSQLVHMAPAQCISQSLRPTTESSLLQLILLNHMLMHVKKMFCSL